MTETATRPAAETPECHPAFRFLGTRAIPALNLSLEHYEHRATGAAHYHLAVDHPENVFLVAFRTVPKDSTGVAHILEHTVLCGSERYPVRDPFFMMLRRSLNTFMNAFTSSDWTAYPFATQNRKDFDNLLEVYLDAVFFSQLDPMDFAQEGHRVEFSDPEDTESELVFKGVVYNEMKGAMSSVSSLLWQTLCEHLFPTTTYHYNSGGDPEHIPDLTYTQLRDFYRTHYHPSNAIFMTFGDIPAAGHQAVFEDRALKRFDRLDQRIAVAREKPLSKPLVVTEPYAFDEESETAGRTHIVVGWLLGDSTDLETRLEAQLLASVLLDNSASPLLHALETSELGTAPSPLCGLEDSQREIVFACGLEGSEEHHREAVEALVIDVLEDVACNGVALEQVEAVLHQLELHQREIGGDGFPYGLQLIMQALSGATHYSDPVEILDLDPVLDKLEQRIRDTGYIKGLARRMLLENNHRVTLVMPPDRDLSAQRAAAEKARLVQIRDGMDAMEREAVVQRAGDLQKRQEREDDPEILPRLALDDVPPSIHEVPYEEHRENDLKITTYSRGTNGLVYRQLLLPMPQLSARQLQLLPLYTDILTEVGMEGTDYRAIQQRQASTVGSLRAFTTLRGSVNDEQAVSGWFVLSSKCLQHNSRAQSELMLDTLEKVRFDELDRMGELVSQQRSQRDQGITGQGHSLAMVAACAGMSPAAELVHRLSGLEGIHALRELDDSLREQNRLASLGEELSTLHQLIAGGERQMLSIAEQPLLEELRLQDGNIWGGHAAPADQTELELDRRREPSRQLWLTSSAVSFCARAYPTVPSGHPDAPALTVLAGFLRNGFLHRTIREQGGAYGGGASQDSSNAAFRFFSYRDPRMEETLTDFDRSIEWLLETVHERRSLEEAILGVVGSLDKPGSPAGEARQDFHSRLFGRDHAHRELFRKRVLEVEIEDLKRVAGQYLQPEHSSTAVVTGWSNAKAAEALAGRLDLQVHRL